MAATAFPPMRVLTAELHLKLLLSSLWDMFECDEQKDVVLECNGNNFMAHSLVLMAYSPVFKSMLSPNAKLGEIQTICIDCYGISHQAMDTILKFMYSGCLLVTGELEPLMHAAEQLKMPYLKLFISKLMRIRDADAEEDDKPDKDGSETADDYVEGFNLRSVKVEEEEEGDQEALRGSVTGEEDDSLQEGTAGGTYIQKKVRDSYHESLKRCSRESIARSLREDPEAYCKKPGLYQCPHCAFTCRIARSIRRHLYTHLRRVTPSLHKKCEDCGLTFTSFQCYSRHRRTKHLGRPPNTHKCSYCSYTTPYIGSMEQHLAHKHNRDKSGAPAEKRFQCQYCDYKTYWKAYLTKHEMRHRGELPFKCDECDYATNSSSVLKTHKAKHSVGHAYVCEVCGKGLTTMAGLKAHELTHKGVKPFVCSVCQRGFSARRTFVAHRFSHIGKLPYGCSECEFESRCSKMMRQHYEQVHDLHGKIVVPRYELLGDPTLKARITMRLENKYSRRIRIKEEDKRKLVPEPLPKAPVATSVISAESVQQLIAAHNLPSNIIVIEQDAVPGHDAAQVDWNNTIQINQSGEDVAFAFTVLSEEA